MKRNLDQAESVKKMKTDEDMNMISKYKDFCIKLGNFAVYFLNL